VRGTDEEILKLFYEVEELTVKEAEKLDDLPNKVLIEDAWTRTRDWCGAGFRAIEQAVVKQIAELGVAKIKSWTRAG